MIRSAIATLFALSLGTGAPGGVTYNYSSQYDFVLDMTGGCAQEPIRFTGNAHTTLKQDFANGVWTYRGHVNSQGIKGVGALTGNGYTLNLIDKVNSEYAVDGSATEFSYKERYNVIGQGNGVHFTMLVAYHVSMGGNSPAESVFSVQANCK